MPRQWWVGGATPLPLLAVAGGTGEQTSLGVTQMVERQLLGRWRAAAGGSGKASIINRDRAPVFAAQLLGDPAHLRVIAAPVAISLELAFHIAGVEPRQPRRTGAIALAGEAVTAEAGVGGASLRPAERDHPPVRREAIERGGLGIRAAGQQGRRGQREKSAHRAATAGLKGLFPLALLSLAACKPPPEPSQSMPEANAAHGRALIERAGCGSCHSIPGVRWPQGKVGPSLDGLAGRGLIAGRLPNRPDVLAAYIQNAPALVPGSAMPSMPVTQSEARDIAVYLYEQGAE